MCLRVGLKKLKLSYHKVIKPPVTRAVARIWSDTCHTCAPTEIFQHDNWLLLQLKVKKPEGVMCAMKAHNGREIPQVFGQGKAVLRTCVLVKPWEYVQQRDALVGTLLLGCRVQFTDETRFCYMWYLWKYSCCIVLKVTKLFYKSLGNTLPIFSLALILHYVVKPIYIRVLVGLGCCWHIE